MSAGGEVETGERTQKSCIARLGIFRKKENCNLGAAEMIASPQTRYPLKLSRQDCTLNLILHLRRGHTPCLSNVPEVQNRCVLITRALSCIGECHRSRENNVLCRQSASKRRLTALWASNTKYISTGITKALSTTKSATSYLSSEDSRPVHSSSSAPPCPLFCL